MLRGTNFMSSCKAPKNTEKRELSEKECMILIQLWKDSAQLRSEFKNFARFEAFVRRYDNSLLSAL
jgi:hypothetical protein